MIARTAKTSGHAVAGVRLRRRRRTGPAVPGGDRRPPQASYRTAHGRVRSGDARRITCRASCVCGLRRRGAVPPASPGLRDPCMPDRGSRGGRDTAKPGRKPFGVRTASHAVATVRTVFGAVPGSGAPCRLQPAAALAVRESAGNRSPGFRVGGRSGFSAADSARGRFRVRRDRADRPVRIRGTGAGGARHSRAGGDGTWSGAHSRAVPAPVLWPRDIGASAAMERTHAGTGPGIGASCGIRRVRVRYARVQMRACGRLHARFIRRSGFLRTPDPGR